MYHVYFDMYDQFDREVIVDSNLNKLYILW